MGNYCTVDTSGFWKNGYLLIRDVFDPSEIGNLREAALQSRAHRGDLLSNELLRHVLLDPRVLSVAHLILGGTPVYFGDSSLSVGDHSHGYHKDNPDRNAPDGPDWRGQYTIVRFGLYLQNHARHSGGLNVRARSHNARSVEEGRNVYLRTRPGDLVVWNLRTSHSGNGRLLRFPRGLYPEPRVADALPRFLFAPTAGERLALFFTLGLDNHHLRRYIAYLATRAYMVQIWQNSHYDDEVWAALEGKGLVLKDIWPMIESQPSLGANETHVALPF
jgi:hypothetical protein